MGKADTSDRGPISEGRAERCVQQLAGAAVSEEDRERTLSAHRGPPLLDAKIGDPRPRSIRRTAHLLQARKGRDPEGPRPVAPIGPPELTTANGSEY
jgi:hypothetical protein